ncbi:UNVERIFIED_CONTAM: hypothetical protein GTU68_022002 [Idotea baltica]|nr:hypothetical protein [Idotea baltica]
MVSEGDVIEVGQGVVELETDKATVVVDSEVAGTVTKVACAEGDTLAVGDVILLVEASSGAAAAPAESAPAPAESAPAPAESAPAPAPEPAPAPAPEPAPAPAPVPVAAAPVTPAAPVKPMRVEKMPKIRQTIAKKMHESWTTCPRVTNFDDADVTALEEMRQRSKAEYAAGGVKLTTMPFLVKAVAMALKANPVMNASVDLENGQIIYKDYVNVGIAVDTERGLVVPNLRNADQLGIPDVARQLGTLAENVRGNNFSVKDLQGGTFTISNLGAIGGTYSTPIINTPETAILLVGRSRKLPVVVENDEVAVRLMMPLSLSYDHRLIDGGAAARFLNDVISYLESPSRLLLAL